jgi:hypothetical protein
LPWLAWVGEFNQLRILVQGRHGEHWLNGAKILEYELESPELLHAVAMSKYRDLPAPDLPPTWRW